MRIDPLSEIAASITSSCRSVHVDIPLTLTHHNARILLVENARILLVENAQILLVENARILLVENDTCFSALYCFFKGFMKKIFFSKCLKKISRKNPTKSAQTHVILNQ